MGGFVIFVAILFGFVLSPDGGTDQQGACDFVYLQSGEGTESAVVRVVEKVGADPDRIGGIHAAAVKGNKPYLQAGQPVSACLNKAGTWMYSVNGVRLQG